MKQKEFSIFKEGDTVIHRVYGECEIKEISLFPWDTMRRVTLLPITEEGKAKWEAYTKKHRCKHLPLHCRHLGHLKPGTRKPTVKKVEFDQSRNDLSWKMYCCETLRWGGYDDGNWWQCVMPQKVLEGNNMRKCKCGKEWYLDYKNNEATLKEER